MWSLLRLLRSLSLSLMSIGESGGRPGQYERYVLALGWLPQLVYDEACPDGPRPNPRLVHRMDRLPPDGYALTRLSVHGLWPEYDRTHYPHGWPQYCMRDDASGCADVSEDDYQCGLLTSTLSSFNTSELWQRSAMSYAWTTNAAAHQWRKHGTCTPYSQFQYFDTIESVREAIGARSGSAMIRQVAAAAGRHAPLRLNVSAAEVRGAFAADTGYPPVLRCSAGCLLAEVRIGLLAAGTLRPRAGHGVALDHSDDSCAACDNVALIPWKGCPRHPPPPASPPAVPAPPLPPRPPAVPPSPPYQPPSPPSSPSPPSPPAPPLAPPSPPEPPAPPGRPPHTPPLPRAPAPGGAEVAATVTLSSVGALVLIAAAVALVVRFCYRRRYARLDGEGTRTARAAPATAVADPPSPGGTSTAGGYDGHNGGGSEMGTTPIKASSRTAAAPGTDGLPREVLPEQVVSTSHLVVDDSEIVD